MFTNHATFSSRPTIIRQCILSYGHKGSYEPPNSYEFRSSQTFVEGGIIYYGLLTMFVWPRLNLQEQLETFLRKWSAFRSYDCPRVLTFFVLTVPWDIPTAYFNTAILRFLLSQGGRTAPLCATHGTLKSLVGRSYDFRHILSGYINGCRLLSKILCPRITSSRKLVEKFDIFKMVIMPWSLCCRSSRFLRKTQQVFVQ